VDLLPNILAFLVLPLLLAASAFFSGSETALFSLSAQARHRMRRAKSFYEQAPVTLLEETRHLLITLLLGNMTVNVAYIVTATVLSLRLQTDDPGAGITVALLNISSLIALILLGEVIPKQIANRFSEGWARVTSVPLLFVHRAIAPLRLALNALIITPLARLIHPSQKPARLSPAELEALLKMSQDTGVIDDSEEAMLRQVMGLGQMKVRELMTPRVDMTAYNLHDDPNELAWLVEHARLSEIPVYRGDLDHIAGLVRVRDVLLRRPRSRRALEKLVRPVRFVPEIQRGDELLRSFRNTGTTFAVVVDEYGGTSGVVTLEDVVEHMVGEIAEPGEPIDPASVQPIDETTWRVGADLSVREWPEFFGATTGLRERAAATIGGLVMAELGRLPQVGDKIRLGNVSIQVSQMQGRRLRWLTVHVHPPEQERADAADADADARHGPDTNKFEAAPGRSQGERHADTDTDRRASKPRATRGPDPTNPPDPPDRPTSTGADA